MNDGVLQAVVAIVVILAATIMFVAYHGESGVEPQSVFTLYGAVLGYVFGRQTGRQQERRRATDK